jgi:integrase
MSVRKRTLPSGRISWQVDYKDQGGKRRSKQFPTKTAAINHETTVRGQIAAGTHVADSQSITVSQAGDLWLRRAEVEKLEASTQRQYRQHLDLHIKPLIDTTKLSRLTKPAVEQFRDQLLATRSRPLTRAILTSLKGVVKEAHRRGLVGHNPASDAEVRVSKRDRTTVAIPSKAELREMIAKSAELWPITRVEQTRPGEQRVVAISWRPLLLCAIFGGLRASELRGLVWDHVDLEAGVVQVRGRADFRNHLGAPKSAASARDVPMSPLLRNTLREWRLACPVTTINLVFPTTTGNFHTSSGLYRHYWAPLQIALGLVELAEEDGELVERPKYKFHALRHAAASLFIEQNWTPKKVMTVMGHSSIQVTYDRYGHLWKSPEDDLQAMAQIEARLLA